MPIGVTKDGCEIFTKIKKYLINMIERYSRKKSSIWDDYNRYSIWLQIELAAAEAMERLNLIPKGVVKKLNQKQNKSKRINRGKSKTHIIAFLTSITEKAGKE